MNTENSNSANISFSQTLEYGKQAIAATFVLNTGACVLLLNIIGSLLPKHYSLALSIAGELFFFEIGSVMSILTYGAAYFAQQHYTYADSARSAENYEAWKRSQTIANRFRWGCFVLLVGSLIFFGFGAYGVNNAYLKKSADNLLTNFKPNLPKVSK